MFNVLCCDVNLERNLNDRLNTVSPPSFGSSQRRHWAWKNALCGGFDASWGALGMVLSEMGLSSADLEEPQAEWATPMGASKLEGVG